MNIKNKKSIKQINSSDSLINIEFNTNRTQNKNDAIFWINEIKQLNKELKLKHILKENKFNSEGIILNSLNLGKSFDEKVNKDIYHKKKINEIIKDIKEKAKAKYITHKTEKNKKNLNEDFHEILDKSNYKIRIKLEKYFDFLINLKNEQMKITIENDNLEKEIEKTNNEANILKEKLKIKNEEIDQKIKNFDVYDNVKPFFRLIKQFPEKEPREIIIEFFTNKQNLIDHLNKLNHAKEEFENIIKIRNLEQNKQKKFTKNIIEKINEERETFNNKNQIIEQDILNNERQYVEIKKNSVEKFKYKKLLLFLYKIIKKFIPEVKYNLFIKDLGYNPLNTEDNFDPSIFSNSNYLKLIQEYILSNASKSTEGKLLRNTIVFGNYLARKYLIQNNKDDNYRYNPIETFKNIKIYYDKIKIKNFGLKRKISNLQRRLEELLSKRKNLEKSIHSRKINGKKFLDIFKINKKFEDDYQDNKKNDNINDYNELNHIIKENKKGKRFSKIKNLIIDNNNKGDILLEDIKNKNKFFITDVNKILKKNKTFYKSNLSNENSEKNKLIGNTISNSSKYKIHKDRRNILNYKNIINLKDYKLSLSKNKDKICKTNGIKIGFEIYHNLDKLIKQLAEDEYFDIFNIKTKKNNIKIETNNYTSLNSFNLNTNNQLMKKNKTEINYISSPCQINENNYEKISNQILDNINNIINKIQNIGKDKISKSKKEDL